MPNLYCVKSSKDLNKISNEEVLNKLRIGYPALRSEIKEDSTGDLKNYFNELVKLKEKDKLYSEKQDINIKLLGGGTKKVSAEFILPPKALMADYEVKVFGFKN